MTPHAPQTGPGERNLLIEASAGSGKTHHLVGRILRLLMTFRQPDRIIALTFTRKAAGEFFDRILGALASAAASDEAAAKTAREYRVEGLTRATALGLLRLATDSLHRLSLGTLDSFYSRVLRTFPAEFGIAGGFEIIQESAESAIRRDVFDTVLSDLGNASDFLDAFRQATFGNDEKQLLSHLDAFVTDYHRLLLACPEAERWSRAEAIWPEPPWWLVADFQLDDIVKRLLDGVPAAMAQHKSAGKGIEDFARGLPLFANGATGRTFNSLHTRAMEALDDLRAGRLETIAYHQRGGLKVDPDFQRALADAIGYLFQRDIVTRLQQTAGIHAIVRRYESLYHAGVRRKGRLSFDDILVLLSGAAPDEATGGGTARRDLSMLDDRPDAGQRRLRVDYRLDGRFHHWLIDEFQDTSRPQWQVLQNLIDEVIDDDSGDRSFYYVGDEKQAIYGWRGGDSRLFQEVRRRYNQPSRPVERQIAEEHLDVSWRSGPVILDAVNAVFGNYQGLADLLGPDHAPVIWERWQHTNAGRHEPSERTRQRPGFFQFVTLESGGSGEESGGGGDDDGAWEGADARWEVVRELLNGIDPVTNRLSVAVLMRRTRQAAQLADYLRQHGDIPVMLEGQTLIGADHPVATSFRSLLHHAAHPGDTTAWEHLVMTPALLRLDHEALQRERHRLSREVLARLHDRGFAAVFSDWVDRLATGLADGFDAFTRRRIDQIAEACRRFDLTGSRSIGEFLEHLAGYAVSDAPSAGVVQIMTIHKAKGLTFDAVIVADLKPKAITALQDLSALKGYDAARQLRWVMTSPRKEIALHIEPLRGAHLEAAMDGALEELCNLYVALTRAKYANYIVAPALPRETGSCAPHNLLARQFAAAGSETQPGHIGAVSVMIRHQSGLPDWVSVTAGERSSPEPRPARDARPVVTARRRFPARHRRIPSNAADKKTWGGVARLFSPDSGSATGLGTVVHALFEQIEWIEDLDRSRFDAVLDAAPGFADEALDHLERSLAIDAIRERFARGRHADPLLWIEKRFEMITPDGEWVSGVFDRVTLERDATGRFVAGHIVDYKTNRVATPAEIDEATEHYRSQMTVYRTALARLTGLAEPAIGAELIFTRPGVIRRVF